MKNINWFHYAAPHTFYGLAGKAWPWFAVLELQGGGVARLDAAPAIKALGSSVGP